MLISHKHKFVFVHVPKTGGDSVSAALAEFADVDGSQGRPKHWPARRIRNDHFVGSGLTWSSYHSFGMIRNPWQQVHSDYWFCRRSPVPGIELGSWRDKVIRCKQIDFSQFVVDMCGEHGQSGPGLFRHYLSDRDGNPMVSQVIRQEDLATQWPTLCERLRLPAIELPRKNVTPNRPDYREDYNDRSKFLVGRKFADDVARFGYSFEGATQ